MIRRFCKSAPKCEKCDSPEHDTKDCDNKTLDDFSPNKPEEVDDNSSETADDSPIEIEVRKVTSGPLVSSEYSGDGTTLVINTQHPNYEELRKLMDL